MLLSYGALVKDQVGSWNFIFLLSGVCKFEKIQSSPEHDLRRDCFAIVLQVIGGGFVNHSVEISILESPV